MRFFAFCAVLLLALAVNTTASASVPVDIEAMDTAISATYRPLTHLEKHKIKALQRSRNPVTHNSLDKWHFDSLYIKAWIEVARNFVFVIMLFIGLILSVQHYFQFYIPNFII